MKETTTYTFKYETDTDTIDLNTLLLSQIHLGVVLNEIKQEVAPGADLKIKIKPIEKGSVLLDFVMDLSWLKDTIKLVKDHEETINSIITIFVGLFALREKLGGKKPTDVIVEDEGVTVKTGDTTIKITKDTYKLYSKNAAIDQALKKGFEALEKDDDVSGIAVLDENKKSLISISRESFEDMAQPNEIFEEVSETIQQNHVALTIFKVVFDKGYKWQFYMQGRKISAYVKDDNFMAKINSGERFAKGDTLIVELEVKKVLDSTMNIYIEDEFIIHKVLDHQQRPEQGKLDLL